MINMGCLSEGYCNNMMRILRSRKDRSLQTAQRAYVLETGKIVLQGTGQDLLHTSQVKHAYLGID